MNNAYWKQTRYDEFRLVVGAKIMNFKSFVDLRTYCIKHNIDARLA